jgi:hypothetical protein
MKLWYCLKCGIVRVGFNDLTEREYLTCVFCKEETVHKPLSWSALDQDSYRKPNVRR